MEKKIERVPYISKWYKEEQKDELLHFDFKDETTTERKVKELNKTFNETMDYVRKLAPGGDYDVNKFSFYDENLYTYSTNTTNGLWKNMYHKPISPTLKYVCHLTKEDVDNIDNYIKDIYHKAGDCKRTKTLYRINEICDLTYAIQKYIENIDGIRDKKQRQQLERLEKQSKPQKSYEGTLGEHKEELQKLYQIKEQCGFKFIKDFANGNFPYSTTLSSIKEILGIDFIKDFIKACEKCEKE